MCPDWCNDKMWNAPELNQQTTCISVEIAANWLWQPTICQMDATCGSCLAWAAAMQSPKEQWENKFWASKSQSEHLTFSVDCLWHQNFFMSISSLTKTKAQLSVFENDWTHYDDSALKVSQMILWTSQKCKTPNWTVTILACHIQTFLLLQQHLLPFQNGHWTSSLTWHFHCLVNVNWTWPLLSFATCFSCCCPWTQWNFGVKCWLLESAKRQHHWWMANCSTGIPNCEQLPLTHSNCLQDGFWTQWHIVPFQMLILLHHDHFMIQHCWFWWARGDNPGSLKSKQRWKWNLFMQATLDFAAVRFS